MIVSDILTSAARAARMLGAPGRTLSPSEQTELFGMLNAMLDEWASRKAYVYADTFTQFMITPGHQPHLLGPGLLPPDFGGARLMNVDPDGITLILNVGTSTPVDVPLNVRDADWWNNQRVKSISTSVPTDVYYEASYPNGKLWLWPVPTVAYGLRLRMPTLVTQFVTPQDTVLVPPAYQKAMTLTLAEAVADNYGLPIPAGLPMRAARARNAVQMANLKSPRVGSTDIGVGQSGKIVPTFNYLTGQ